MCLKYLAVTAPIGSKTPHETAFRIPCTVFNVLVSSLWAALKPYKTSMVAMEDKSLEVVGWIAGE
jgi:hypothetical protein